MLYVTQVIWVEIHALPPSYPIPPRPKLPLPAVIKYQFTSTSVTEVKGYINSTRQTGAACQLTSRSFPSCSSDTKVLLCLSFSAVALKSLP